MSFTAYIVPGDLLKTNPPRGPEHHATGIPPDFANWLVVIRWDDSNAEAEFEALPGVLPLGAPWEPLPAEAASLLAPLQDQPAITAGAVAIPVDGAPAPEPTVSQALKGVSWNMGRLLR